MKRRWERQEYKLTFVLVMETYDAEHLRSCRVFWPLAVKERRGKSNAIARNLAVKIRFWTVKPFRLWLWRSGEANVSVSAAHLASGYEIGMRETGEQEIWL